jgi:DNA-binding MurR/RpiR family transcriptional regulator
VIVDIRRYARHARLLAEAAAQARVPVAVITDAHCHWARPFTSDVFHVNTEVGLFWDSNAAITSLLNLLTNAVIGRLAPAVGRRSRQLEALQGQFGAFLD